MPMHTGVSEVFLGISVPMHTGISEVFAGVSVPMSTDVSDVFVGIGMLTFGLEQIEEKNGGKSKESPQTQSL